MRLPLSNSKIQFPKILLLVSFISFSMDSLSECLYGMSDRELTAKNGEHIITSSKSFANLQLLIMFWQFYLSYPKEQKVFNRIEEFINKERSTISKWEHYIPNIIPMKQTLVIRSCSEFYLSLIVGILFLFMKHL